MHLKNELLLNSLLIDTSDIVLIRKWISTNTLVNDLTFCNYAMFQVSNKDFCIYTDRSLNMTESNISGHKVIDAE
jgi:hypothetical protein